jgi:ParB family chromosome partitioning protein
MAQKPTLGKGLASLLPGAGSSAGNLANGPQVLGVKSEMVQNSDPAQKSSFVGATAAGPASFAVSSPGLDPSLKERWPGITLAGIDEIQTNQFQPRREFNEQSILELAQSIEANGIIQPLVVRKAQNGYQLIAGERRLRAAKLLGIRQVPVVIRKSTDKESLEVALVENIQRENLNCVDEALAYFQLMQDFTLTQEEVATRVGKDRATVANYLRLLRLPEAIIDDLKRSILSFGHGKALLSLDDVDNRLRARAIIVEKRLSVRDAEALIEHMKKTEAESAGVDTPMVADHEVGQTPGRARLTNLAHELSRQFGSRVDVKGNEKRGKIQIYYSNKQDLERVLQLLQKSAH